MPNELNGSLVVTEVSVDNIVWKFIVCEEESKLESSGSVAETKTKCGPFVAITNNMPKITGNGVSGAYLASNQLSFAQLLRYQQANTKLWFRRQNQAAGSGVTAVLQGETTYVHGQGYVSNVTETAHVGEVDKFTFELTFSSQPTYNIGS